MLKGILQIEREINEEGQQHHTGRKLPHDKHFKLISKTPTMMAVLRLRGTGRG